MSANVESSYRCVAEWHVPALALASVCFCSAARAEVPTNVELIAAMPAGVESVMVQRESVLKSKGSLVRDLYTRSLPIISGNDLKTIVTNARGRAMPLVFAWGGSDFKMPPDSGMTGNYSERAIYVVEQSLDALRVQLETGAGVSGLLGWFEFDGVRVFEGTIEKGTCWGETHNSAGESWFVAIPNPHTIVSAETRTDIEYMLSSLKAHRTALPPRWRVIAEGHDLESGVLILREYPPNDQLLTPGPPRDAGVKQLAFTWTDPRTAIFKVSLAAEKMDEAVKWYRTFGGLGGDPPSWDNRSTSTGVLGPIRVEQSRASALELAFRFITLFGIVVMI